jgi:putative ATP-dependent endonuclease of the OLD family
MASKALPKKKTEKASTEEKKGTVFLSKIDIANFRGIKKLSLSLDETTVLIGENNTSKTSILDAIQLCLSRTVRGKAQVFSEYDYHLAEKKSQPVDSDPIEITLHFAERKEGDWPDEIVQVVADGVQVNGKGLQSVTLRITSGYDEAAQDFITDWDCLDLAGEPLIKAKQPRFLIQLQQLAPVFYLAALRDAAQEFRARSQFWGPFVRSVKVDPVLREELEKSLSELNQKVLDSHESFDKVKERLKRTSTFVPLDSKEPVWIEAIPGKVFDMLSRTQVLLASKTGARLPIGRHGEGTQSLAVICLFDAFLESQLEGRYEKFAIPIIALEEPEAHLHPSAIRAVGKMLQEFKGQKLIATHSGDLVSSVPLLSLRRLSRRGGVLTVHQVKEGTLSVDEIAKLNYYVRESRGRLIFARCWLFIEGESDWIIYNECAKICGHDLISEGVYCIEHRAAVGIEGLVKLAEQLGIEWVVAADNDQQGQADIKNSRPYLGTRPETRHLHVLPHIDIETYLCVKGYGGVYEANISPQKKHLITAKSGTVEYWQQVTKAQPDKSKPRNALAVVGEIEKKGKAGVPAELRTILDTALEISREAT